MPLPTVVQGPSGPGAGAPDPFRHGGGVINPPQQAATVQAVQPVQQDHFKNGKLTKFGMQEALKRKGSFIHNGQIITADVIAKDPSRMPSDSDLAAATGDTSSISAQIEANNAAIQKSLDENRKLEQVVKAQTAQQQPPVQQQAGPSLDDFKAMQNQLSRLQQELEAKNGQLANATAELSKAHETVKGLEDLTAPQNTAESTPAALQGNQSQGAVTPAPIVAE